MSAGVTPQQRRITLTGIAAGMLVSAALWLALLSLLPPPATANAFITALACCAIAALLTLVVGVEAVAHERLVTAAIDPLACVETPRMRVNQRYLANTVEQFIVFASGLLLVSLYAPPRIVVIVTIVWVLARWAFWLGYHRSSLLRGLGAPGMAQSMLVLLYAVYRFAFDAYGKPTAIVLLLVFGLIEALLFWLVLRRNAEGEPRHAR
jgi:hypothetical protein